MECARVLSAHHPIYIIELGDGKTLMTSAPLYAPVHTDFTTITEFYHTFIDTDTMRTAAEDSRKDGTLDTIRRTLAYMSPTNSIATTTKRLESQLDAIIHDINNSMYENTPSGPTNSPANTPIPNPTNTPTTTPALTARTLTTNPIITPATTQTTSTAHNTHESDSSTSTGIPPNPMHPDCPDDWEMLPTTPIRHAPSRTPEELAQPTPTCNSPLSTWSDYEKTCTNIHTPNRSHSSTDNDSDSDDDTLNKPISATQRTQLRRNINLSRQFFLDDSSTGVASSTSTKPPLHPDTMKTTAPTNKQSNILPVTFHNALEQTTTNT
jgi:hypothetical protein